MQFVATDLSYPHLQKTDGEPARLRRLPRIRVAQIAMDYLAHGWSADEMCRQHDHLTLAEVHAALAYYFDHQDEVDQEIRDDWKQADQSRSVAAPSPLVAKLRSKGLL